MLGENTIGWGEKHPFDSFGLKLEQCRARNDAGTRWLTVTDKQTGAPAFAIPLRTSESWRPSVAG